LSKLACTQEEKLEPLKNINDDPRIRLLNRLYAKKRKELQERQKLKVIMIGFCMLCSTVFSNFTWQFSCFALESEVHFIPGCSGTGRTKG
jgi:hypothetical protein